jgi:sugar phosphate isomerase/epimerase
MLDVLKLRQPSRRVPALPNMPLRRAFSVYEPDIPREKLDMSLEKLSINFATVRQAGSFGGIVDACLRHGITSISPWREHVAEAGLDEAARIVKANGLRVTGHCRGGFFPAADAAGRQAAIDDNRRAIDEAAALTASCLVMVVGGLPKGSRDLAGARRMVSDGLAEILPYARQAGVKLALEPLHPFYAAERACLNTLKQSLDLCDELGDGTGVAIDVYHVWWDPELEEQVARAGRNRQILAHHICDWLVPTTDPLNDRGMMGDGVVDLGRFRAMIENAGFHGPQEVEIFSRSWQARPVDEVLATIVERYNSVCQPTPGAAAAA